MKYQLSHYKSQRPKRTKRDQLRWFFVKGIEARPLLKLDNVICHMIYPALKVEGYMVIQPVRRKFPD